MIRYKINFILLTDGFPFFVSCSMFHHTYIIQRTELKYENAKTEDAMMNIRN